MQKLAKTLFMKIGSGSPITMAIAFGIFAISLLFHNLSAEPKSYCWMDDIDGGWTITDLSIPGTHDSGTYDFNNPWAICQEYDIYGQLYLGARYLDLRVAMKGEIPWIAHGKAGLAPNLTLTKALDQVCNFLYYCPSEVVICQFRAEYSVQENDVVNAVDKLIDSEPYKSYVWQEPRLPKLEEVRGKFLYWKFYTGKKGKGAEVTWGTSDGGRTGDKNIPLDGDHYDWTIYFSDQYTLNSGPKFSVVKPHLLKLGSMIDDEAVYNIASKKIYLTYTSTQWGGTWPYSHAELINPKLIKLFNDETYYRYFGIVAVDFLRPGLANAIWNSNFRPLKGTAFPSDVVIDNPDTGRGKSTDLFVDFNLSNNHAIVTPGIKPEYILIMQPDNNLVLYFVTKWSNEKDETSEIREPKRGMPIWASNTCGRGTYGTAYAKLQSSFDGNFVVYAEPGDVALWSSGSSSKGNGLVLQKSNGFPPFCSMVLYQAGAKPNPDYSGSIWRAPYNPSF